MRYRALFYLNSCSTKIQQLMSTLCFEKTSAFRLSTALSESSSLSDILPFKCSISGRTGLFAASSVSVGLSGKFEQLDNLENYSLLYTFLVRMQGTLSYIKIFRFLHTLKVCVQRQCVAKFLSPLYCHCCCFCVQQHTHTQSALSE